MRTLNYPNVSSHLISSLSSPLTSGSMEKIGERSNRVSSKIHKELRVSRHWFNQSWYGGFDSLSNPGVDWDFHCHHVNRRIGACRFSIAFSILSILEAEGQRIMVLAQKYCSATVNSDCILSRATRSDCRKPKIWSTISAEIIARRVRGSMYLLYYRVGNNKFWYSSFISMSSPPSKSY